MHNVAALFEDTLQYTAPSSGDWGLVRIAALLPESHTLFFCPSACGRHGALGAIDQGYKHRVSYCYLSQPDIVEGCDEAIRGGVRELISRLPSPPRVLLLYVSCLDDLIGTDLDALRREFEVEYPGIRFRVGHMNPISLEGNEPPPVTTQNLMYDLLDVPKQRDKGLNFIGNFVPVDPESELFAFLHRAGIAPTRHIADYSSFDAYQEMARSAFNIVLMPGAKIAAENLEKRLGTPWLFLPVTYDLDEIPGQYEKIAGFIKTTGATSAKDTMNATGSAGATRVKNTMNVAGSINAARAEGTMNVSGSTNAARAEGTMNVSGSTNAASAAEIFDFSEAIRMAEKKIAAARDTLAGRPVSIAGGAVLRPFSLAKAMLRYGFNVESVVAEEALPFDADAEELISLGVKLVQPQRPDTILFADRSENAVAIGYDAAYVAGTRNIVNLANDHTLFGYHGLGKLMDMIAEASVHESDLLGLITEAGVML